MAWFKRRRDEMRVRTARALEHELNARPRALRLTPGQRAFLRSMQHQCPRCGEWH